MLQPFVWMFKTENFREHLIYLLSVAYGALLIVVVLYFASAFFKEYLIYFIIAGLIIYISSILCLQGYFWYLASNIAERKTEISASSIYNGKIKKIIQIELPEIHTFRFIWRGIAAAVASALFFYPLFVLLILPAILSGMAFDSIIAGGITYLVMYALIGLFIPALLWNYAIRNSVVAMWNIPRAIHLLGCYTGRYLLNTAIFLILAFITKVIIAGMQIGLNLTHFTPDMFNDSVCIIKIAIFMFVLPIINIFGIYVNAYLLGTIAPPSEV